MDRKINVFVADLNKNVSLSPELTLLEGLLEAGVPLEHSCGGFGTCGTCRVFVAPASLPTLLPREGVELEMAKDRNFSAEERLCCQIHPVSGLVIYRTKKGLP
jgi:2Fe-2S ferredoxin